MTIDKARRYLRLMLSGMKYEEGLTQIKEDKEIELLNIEAVKVAQETMRKYQKIKEIINAEVDPNFCNNFGDVRKVQAIRKVIKDGND